MSSDFSHDRTFGSLKRDYALLYPTKELNFTLQNGIYIARLAISNTNTQAILYKIKITATRFYHVHPTAGKLLPGEKILINIKMPFPEQPEERVNDRFLVQAFPINDPYIIDDVQEVMEVFKTQMPPADLVQQNRFKVYFDLPKDVHAIGSKLKSPMSLKGSSKQVTWKSELEEKEEALNGVRTASTNNSLKHEEEIRSPANSILNLNNNQDNSMQIFTPPKQIEHRRTLTPENLNNTSGSITFRRINLKSTGTKKKSIADEIKASMSRGNQRADMTEALLPGKGISNESYSRNIRMLDDNNNNISTPDISQGGISDVSAGTAARRNLILKQKYHQLETKYKSQKTQLEVMLAEKDEYLYQLNKLKHIFSDYLTGPLEEQEISCKKSKAMKFEAWQLIFVSIGFLILGSIIAS